MRKVGLYMAIACSTFGVSVSLTNIRNLLSPADVSAKILQPPVVKAYLSVPNLSVFTTEPGLFEIYRDYALAQTNHDLAFFERVEADDFIVFQGYGRTLSRAEDIQWLRNSPAGITYTYDDLNVKIYGDAAVVTGRMTASYSDGHSYSWRWLDVCRRRGGRWQIQSTTQVD